ncbi:hypothetical protein D3C77_697790 [compost metagenome]
MAAAHSQWQRRPLAKQREPSERLVVDPPHHAGLCQQQLPGRGQRHAAGVPDQQGRAQALFEFLHVVGQRRLAQPQMPGCQTQALVGRDVDELS